MATRKPRGTAADKPDPFAPEPRQQELAPAPVAPVADAARQAIATINTQLAEFDQVEAGLADLERKYKGVAYPVDTKQGMEDAVLARREVKGVRVKVEHARKAAKAPVLALGRDIDERAQKITERLLVIEDPIDDQIKVREQAEAARKQALQQRVDEIVGTPRICIGKTSAQLQEVLDGLNSLPLDTFEEFREAAAKAQFDAVQAVQHLLTQARQAEELAELQRQQKAEADRKEAIQARIRNAITQQLTTVAMCRTSARVQALLFSLQGVVIDDSFQEFAPAAREEKARVLTELARIRDEKKAAEDAAAAAAEAEAAARRAEQATKTHSNGAPMFGEHIKENGDRIMLDADGKRSVFCDIDEGDEPQRAPTTSAAQPTHDQVNDESAARIMRDFGGTAQLTDLERVGRSIGSDFLRVMAGPLAPQKPESEGPAAAPAPAESSISATRPSDAEILAVLADHYDEEPATVAGWLKTFDAAAALAQQSLIPTT